MNLNFKLIQIKFRRWKLNKDQPAVQGDVKSVVNSFNSSNNNSNSPNRCKSSNHLSNRTEEKKTLINKLLLCSKNLLKKSKFKSIRKLIELLKMNKLLLKDKTQILPKMDLIEGFALKGFLLRYQISKFWESFGQTKGTSMFLL